ncbi:MAG: glutathione S-transferase family protein [Pseudomonadota bacterium]
MDGEPVVESAAQILVLADLDPEGRLAPKITDPARARYVHWLVTVPVSLEPMVMPIFNRIPTPGTAQKIKSAFEIQTRLFEGPYCVGHHLTAADIFLHWGLRLMAGKGALKDAPFWLDYLQRLEPELSWATLHPTKPGFLDDAGSVHIT